MIHIIGNGGHAKVVRQILAATNDRAEEDYWLIAIGDNRVRMVKALEHDRFWKLVHPSAIWRDLEGFGEGSTIGMCVSVGPAVRIGKHCIINDGVRLTHDIVIEDFAHIAPGAIICGGVHIGQGALVGAGAVCLPGAKVEPWTVVKAGSVCR